MEWPHTGTVNNVPYGMKVIYSGRGKFMPLPLKCKILETPRSLATDDIKMFLL